MGISRKIIIVDLPQYCSKIDNRKLESFYVLYLIPPIYFRWIFKLRQWRDRREPVPNRKTRYHFLGGQPHRTRQSSNSKSDTANTPQTVVGANDKSLNDAMLNDTSVSDTSISSMSELSGNTSFHEASIAFSDSFLLRVSKRHRTWRYRWILLSTPGVDLKEVANSLTLTFA